MINIKTIGIIIRKFTEANTEFIGTRFDVFNTLNKFNVNLIGIPITMHFQNIKHIISLCDGIILTGGDRLTDNDYLLIKYLYDNDIPTLGICLGMQTIALAYGAIEEKIDNHYSNEYYVHSINIFRDTKLYEILKQDQINVNSRHRYSIKNTNFKISAISPDNIIEGIEDPEKRFFIGLEWHPESINDNNSNLLFKFFVDSL